MESTSTNEIIHELMGSSVANNWDSPPGAPEHKSIPGERLTSIFGNANIGAFKVPKLLECIDPFVDLFPFVEYVGIFRNPNKSIRHLEKKGYCAIGSAAPWILWRHYAKKMLWVYDVKGPFPLFEFDASLDPAAVCATLDLSPPAKCNYDLNIPDHSEEACDEPLYHALRQVAGEYRAH